MAVAPTNLNLEQRARDAARIPLAESIVDAYSNWNGLFSTLVANWSPDGERIVFGSLRDGLPEIYQADAERPEQAAFALTRGPERALWGRFTPDGRSILFLSDCKGDENHHIWRGNTDGSNAVDLTPEGTLHRDEPILPRRLPGAMFYSARCTTDPTTRLFTQAVTGVGGAARLIYTHPRPGTLADVAPDGSRALLMEWNSSDNIVLLEVAASGAPVRRVFPVEGRRVTIWSASYSASGDRIYLGTDDGRENSLILALDASSGREVARYRNESPPTAVISALVSPKGDTVVASIDAGNHGQVRILDAATLGLIRPVQLPLGDIRVGSFRDDGAVFSLMISVPDRPADIHAVDVRTGAVKALRHDARVGIDNLPAVDTTIEIVEAFDGLRIPINCYLPSKRGTRRLPTLVNFHGGPSASYAVRWSAYTRFFLALGYAVLEPNVRGSTGFGRAYEMADNREKRADWLKDVETVNTWVKSQPWCDPGRVVVWGGSYGGYTTLMALTRQPQLWAAGVNIFGVADLKTFLRTTEASIREFFVKEFGDLERDSALLEEFSPMRDVNRIVAPLFVYAGEHDPRVPRSESDLIVQALRDRAVPVEYMVAANEGHSVDRRESKIELLTRTARFLEDALG